jgi:hypothetical protein
MATIPVQPLNKDRHISQRRGRHEKERLSSNDSAFIKGRISETYSNSFTAFYDDATDTAKDPKYKGFKQPKDVETVNSAFANAFSGKRSLPEIYWKVLEELLGITRDSLPSRTEVKQTTATKSEIPAKFDLSLTNLFKDLPADSIKSHIASALSPTRGEDAVKNSIAEILSPKCIHIIAKKLVNDSIDNFEGFYVCDYDSPPNIKRAVASVIAENPELRVELATKVAQCGFWTLIGWLQQFSFFCPREVMVEVEHAFIHESNNNQDFRHQYELCSLDHFCNLISYFSKFGCDYIVFYFKSLCFEDDMKLIRETYAADPKDVKRFVSLIGEKEFRSQVVRSLDKKQMASFRRQLDALAPRER